MRQIEVMKWQHWAGANANESLKLDDGGMVASLSRRNQHRPGRRMRFRLAKATDVGRVRKANEDSVCLVRDDDARAALVVVADGMGGAAAGEIASSSAVSAMKEAFSAAAVADSDQLLRWVRDANAGILAKSSEDTGMEGMGTTLTALYLHDEAGVLVQVGDSRAYRRRGGAIERLTEDQSAWSDSVRKGGSPSVEYGRNHLTNAVGLEDAVEVATIGPFELRAGDRFLLCSDGVWGYVTDPEILAALGGDIDTACRRLIDLANARGGADNITVAAAEVLDD